MEPEPCGCNEEQRAQPPSAPQREQPQTTSEAGRGDVGLKGRKRLGHTLHLGPVAKVSKRRNGACDHVMLMEYLPF